MLQAQRRIHTITQPVLPTFIPTYLCLLFDGDARPVGGWNCYWSGGSRSSILSALRLSLSQLCFASLLGETSPINEFANCDSNGAPSFALPDSIYGNGTWTMLVQPSYNIDAEMLTVVGQYAIVELGSKELVVDAVLVGILTT